MFARINVDLSQIMPFIYPMIHDREGVGVCHFIKWTLGGDRDGKYCRGGGAFVLKLLYEQPYMITLQVKEWIKINGIIL